MITMLIFAAWIFIIYTIIKLVKSATYIYKYNLKIKRAELEYERLEERNYNLYYFQLRLIKNFGNEVIEAMPDYKEILYSDKPLEAKHWVDVDKLVNLN